MTDLLCYIQAIKQYYSKQISEDEESDLEGDVKEREAAAHPKEASFYKKRLTVTQKLFKQEIDAFDKAEQVKKEVKNAIKYHTGHSCEWFNNMSSQQIKEVNNAKEKWNKEGAPEKS